MADLPTNYFDDILSESMNGKKKFRLTYRNGTTEEVTIEDISEYDQYGSKFGAGDINKINQAVNEKFDSDDVVDPMLTTEKGFAADAKLTKDAINKVISNFGGLEFAQDENGNWGYRIVGADSVTPFLNLEDRTPNLIGNKDTASFSAEIGAKYLITVGGMTNTTSWNYIVSGATKLINTDLVYGTKNAGLYPVLQSFIVEATSTTVKVPCGVYACISWFKIS